MIKWALGIFGVLVGLAVAVRFGKREAAQLLNAMAATDGSDEYARYGYLQGAPVEKEEPAVRYYGSRFFEAMNRQGPEEPAVRRARQHITARRENAN